jgi:hypothetical protein
LQCANFALHRNKSKRGLAGRDLRAEQTWLRFRSNSGRLGTSLQITVGCQGGKGQDAFIDDSNHLKNRFWQKEYSPSRLGRLF